MTDTKKCYILGYSPNGEDHPRCEDCGEYWFDCTCEIKEAPDELF